MKIPVLVLFGPTASGKTAVLKRLFEAGKSTIPIEIISADSMQVYRGMDIGTAKPSHEEREKIPHHLIDIRNPNEQFNAGDFVRLAEEACLEVKGRGALPVISGGTGFYIKNLVLGLGEAPPSNPEIREQLKEELHNRGATALMEELKKADPVSADRIHINDEYRLLRALEVQRLTGLPLSSYSSPWSSTKEAAASPFSFTLLGLKRSREEIYNRINARTDAMFKAGLPDEVERLFRDGYTPEDPGLRAIGYREFFVEEEFGSRTWRLSKDIEGVKALVAQNSRRYAKRQLTFFKSIAEVNWIDCEDEEEAVEALVKLLALKV